MSMYLANTAVENTRTLAHSALPDAPVIPDHPRPIRRTLDVRVRVSSLLRSTARRELRLADRIDPACGQAAPVAH